MCFGIASYNVHGVNNGHSGLLELCNNTSIHIIALQEHWLHDGNLHVFSAFFVKEYFLVRIF